MSSSVLGLASSIIDIVVVIINVTLGLVTLFSDIKNAVNKYFFFLTLFMSAWSAALVVAFSSPSHDVGLIALRVAFAAAASIPAFALAFSLYFPSKPKWVNKTHDLIIFLGAIIAIFFSLFTGFIVSDITILSTGYKAQYGALHPFFGLYFAIFAFFALALIVKKFHAAKDLERTQLGFILIGFGVTVFVGITTNLLIPLIIGNSSFSRLGPVGTSVFIIFTTYAIIKLHLLNTKVIATELFSFSLVITLLIRFLLATSSADRLVNGSILIGAVIFSILLIRSVLNEVRVREEVQKLATELEFANKELKRLDQAKSEFISIASHQLRTPLSIIKGYVSMIREGNYGAIGEPMLKTINKVYLSNERLIRLVADLLDLSRMESGKLQYEFADFDFANLVDSIVDEFKNPMHDKNLQLVWAKPAEPFVIWGDSMKLRQVIFNLIDNSLKYTPKGSIEVSLQKSNNTVAVSVKDTGVGMTPETAHSLFQKFSRGKDSSKVNTEGLGLGLFIAKKIVDDHHGELIITSAGEGKGSTFTLTLPIKKYVDPVVEFNNFMENI